MPQRVKEITLGAGEDGEARELPANCLYPLPVARAVLHANYDPRIGLQDTPDERQTKVYTGHLRKVVEINPQLPVADRLGEGGGGAGGGGCGHSLVGEGGRGGRAGGGRVRGRATQARG